MSASPLQTACVHQSVLNPFFHSNFVSRPTSGRLTLTAVTLHKKRTRLGSEKSDCSPAWSWSSFQHRAMRFLASGEPVWLQDGAHHSNGTESSLCRLSITSWPDSARNTSWRSSHPLCRGAYPRNQCFAQQGAAQPLPCRGGPRFPPQHRPRFPEERRALRDRSPPTQPPLAAPGARSVGESRDPLCPPPPLGFRRSTGPSFPGGRMGKPSEDPQDRARGRRLDAPHLTLAPPSAPLTCGLPAAIAPCGAANNRHFFKLQPSREAARPRQRPLAGSGSGNSRRAALRERGSSSRPRAALGPGGAQPSVPALRERPGWRREREAQRADAEETEVPPAPSGHRPAGTGSGVLWQSIVTGTP